MLREPKAVAQIPMSSQMQYPIESTEKLDVGAVKAQESIGLELSVRANMLVFLF